MKNAAVIIAALFIGVFIGYQAADYQKSSQASELIQEKIGDTSLTINPIIFNGHTAQKVAALTFDDGPDPRFTPKILDILKKNKVKATFFDIGTSVQTYPELARREARDGHEIGNHTWDHPELELLTAAQIKSEISLGGKIIKRITGKTPRLFRPPHGIVTMPIFAIAEHTGYRLVMWSISLRERHFKRPASAGLWVAERVAPGAIILAHDGRIDRARVVEALPSLIRKLKNRGYRFVTVDQLPGSNF